MIAPRDISNSGSSKTPLPRPPHSPRGSAAANRFVWGFGIVMVLIAGGAFLMKLIEFGAVLLSDEPMQFAFLPVVTYLMVAAGFGCLFMWAYVTGKFKDIEGPKYRMLEMQEEIDRTGTLSQKPDPSANTTRQ
ncbi:MAG: cbb3-type cytochrome oxidase assembly protein [Phycisphaeraceae bacterium]